MFKTLKYLLQESFIRFINLIKSTHGLNETFLVRYSIHPQNLISLYCSNSSSSNTRKKNKKRRLLQQRQLLHAKFLSFSKPDDDTYTEKIQETTKNIVTTVPISKMLPRAISGCFWFYYRWAGELLLKTKCDLYVRAAIWNVNLSLYIRFLFIWVCVFSFYDGDGGDRNCFCMLQLYNKPYK